MLPHSFPPRPLCQLCSPPRSLCGFLPHSSKSPSNVTFFLRPFIWSDPAYSKQPPLQRLPSENNYSRKMSWCRQSPRDRWVLWPTHFSCRGTPWTAGPLLWLGIPMQQPQAMWGWAASPLSDLAHSFTRRQSPVASDVKQSQWCWNIWEMGKSFLEVGSKCPTWKCGRNWPLSAPTSNTICTFLGPSTLLCVCITQLIIWGKVEKRFGMLSEEVRWRFFSTNLLNKPLRVGLSWLRNHRPLSQHASIHSYLQILIEGLLYD